MSINLETVLRKLKIDSLQSLTKCSTQTLAESYDETQLSILTNSLLKYLWELKLIPSQIKEIAKYNLPVEVLELKTELEFQLKNSRVETVADFIQRDAPEQLTANWSERDRLAVRLGILCLLMLTEGQINELKQLYLPSKPISLHPAPTPKIVRESDYLDQQDIDDFELFDDLFNLDRIPDDFCSPIPIVEKYLFEDVYRLPITTSRRHEIWAGAQMKASQRLQNIISDSVEVCAKEVFISVIIQLIQTWQSLVHLCISNNILLPKIGIWINEILAVRKDFFELPRSRFRNYLKLIEKANCETKIKSEITTSSYDSFELFFALPNLILKHIREFGIEINDDLSEVEKLIQQFDDVDLSAELDQLQRQGLKARNKLVSGYFRSVLKFVRNNFIERDELHSYYLDLVQEGALGLMTAADKYDYRNSGRFINYGITWIWQTTGRSAFEMNRNIRIPVHRSESLSQLEDVYEICLENEGHTSPELLALYLDYFDPEEKKEIREYLDFVINLSPSLSQKWRKIVKSVQSQLKYIENTVSLSIPVPSTLTNSIIQGQMTDTYLLEEIIYDQYSDLLEWIDNVQLKEQIFVLLENFPPRTQEIIKLRFGLDDDKEYTLEEIGERFGVTRERIRQLEAKFIKKVNTTPRLTHQLKKYLSAGTDNKNSMNLSTPLIEFLNNEYSYWKKYYSFNSDPPSDWLWLDKYIEKLPGLEWNRVQDGSTRKRQLKETLRSIKSPAHYSEITELLNDSSEEGIVEERNVYNILNGNEDTFILLGEGVFSLTEWERKRVSQTNPILPFCPQPLPDQQGQTDTLFESVLIADRYLQQSPHTNIFLEYMLGWAKNDLDQSNWLRQSILNSYYLVGLIQYTYHFEGENPLLISTLPQFEITELRKYCVEKLTARLVAMSEFWWIVREYEPGRPADFAEQFVEFHPFEINDVINRLKIMTGLGVARKLPYGRYELTSFGHELVDQLAKKPDFEILEQKDSSTDDFEKSIDFSTLDIGLW